MSRGTDNGPSTEATDPRGITCRELVALVTDYLDGALPPHERAAFEAHLQRCDGCSLHLEQVRVTIATLGRLREDDLPPPVRDRMLAAFRDWQRT